MIVRRHRQMTVSTEVTATYPGYAVTFRPSWTGDVEDVLEDARTFLRGLATHGFRPTKEEDNV
jgi:hypothetical protein